MMSLLSYNQLCQLVEQGVITNVDQEQINSTSIDITLGAKTFTEIRPELGHETASLRKRTPLKMSEHDLQVYGPIVLRPGQFILAQSAQVFHLPPTISAEYKLKSSMARIGLEHLNAGWCDAGWNGSVLTLELKNMNRYHNIELDFGVGIGQMVFFEHEAVPQDRSYAMRGRYNGDTSVSGIKE